MIGLEPFLSALRESGLPVGVAEVARLREVFALEPRLADDLERPASPRLRSILRAVCVKSIEDRDLFERIFDAWLSRSDQELHVLATPDDTKDHEVRPAARRPRRFFWRALAPVLLVLLSLALDGHLKVQPPEPVLPVQSRPQPAPRPSPTVATPAKPAASPAEIRTQTFTTWVPTLSVISLPIWRGWAPLTLGVLALLAAGSLWLAQRGRRWFPPPAPAPVKKGPPRVFLSPPRLAGPQLLAPREQEALVWGIGQFIADEPTRRLDLPATVRATARAGSVPELRFHLARYQREVWLWVDDSTDDPAAQRLADEVEAALLANGLPVERALFRGIPDRLVNAAGQSFAPNEVDERRDAALVAILTDGRVLAGRYAADDLRVRLDTLLRGLSHWPRLAFVDFSPGPGELAGILARHSLERIEPAGMAAFLGGAEPVGRPAIPSVEGDAVWAAACALAPASVDEARAFEIRRRLGLAVPPWGLKALRSKAPGPPGRLQWRPLDRARLVNWLREAEEQPAGDVAAGSLLGRALAFWEEAYDWELKGRGAAGTWWQDTPAHQHLAMERALLGLWRDAPGAVPDLFQLYRGALHDAVARHLGDLAPLDYGEQEHVHLPWRWSDRSDTERAMLQEMGLGGGMPHATLRQPGRLLTGVGLCLGLAVGALGVTALSGPQPPGGPPAVVRSPGPPAVAWWVRFKKISAQGWMVSVGTNKELASRTAGAGAQVTVRWQKQKLPCVSKRGGTEVWSCGGVENPPRPSRPAPRLVIALETPPGNPQAEALAVALLDSGSADVVLIGPGWRAKSLGPEGIAPAGQELLALPDSNWGDLTQALRFEGVRTVAQVWPDLHLLAGNPASPLNGCRVGETIDEAGMEFVHICPGTFTMGSAEEGLAHRVSLSEYWIGKFEASKAQYGSRGQQDLPATEVSWLDANRFCEQHGWSLPTEAQWENAARAGTQTDWSFGDDEKALGDYAWFEGNSGRQPHPVGTRKANPWGISDMHGNVWEWVADWYGPYDVGAQKDPKGPSTGAGRVLRGGAFDDPPRFLRSAIRFRFEPTLRFKFSGFRCARGPSPPTPLPPPSHPAGRGAPPPNK